MRVYNLPIITRYRGRVLRNASSILIYGSVFGDVSAITVGTVSEGGRMNSDEKLCMWACGRKVENCNR